MEPKCALNADDQSAGEADQINAGAGGRLALRTVVACVFFALFYVWVWQCVQPQILYHANQVFLCPNVLISFPLFYKGWAFFEPFATSPGGLAEYASAFLSQYFYYGWLGSLILTGLAWLAYLVTDRLIVALGGGGVARGLRFVTPLLLLIHYNRYTFHVADHLVLLVAMLLLLVYVLLARRRHPIVLLLAAGMGIALVYFVAGALAMLTLALLCAMAEFLANRRRLLALVYLSAAVAAAYLLWPEIDPADIRARFVAWWAGRRLPFDPTAEAAMAGLYLFLFLLMVVLSTIHGLRRRAATAANEPPQPRRPRPVAIGFGLLLLLLVGGTAAFGTHDRLGRKLLRIARFAQLEMWSQVVDEAKGIRPDDFPVYLTTEVNRALFRTGRLLNEMFCYAQEPWAIEQRRWGTLIPQQAEGVRYRGSFELLLRLGCVNEAEVSASEALEMLDARPRILRELALISVVKRRPDTARVFLSALSKDIVHGRWASERLRRLNDDPSLASDKDITHWRSLYPPEDERMPMREDQMLQRLVNWNRQNRMAFEFLMAHYLVVKNLDGIVANIATLREMGYERLPRHIAEAIEIHAIKTGKQPDLHGFEIDQKTADMVEQAMQVPLQYQYDDEGLLRTMKSTFSGMYSTFYLTNQAGVLP